jgi:hypothetical protein
MHTRSESLLIGNPQQQRGQQIAIGRVERFQQRVLVFAGHASNLLKKLLAMRSHFKPIDATVAGIFDAPYQTPLL